MPHTQNINIALKEIIDDYKTAVSVDCVIFGYDENDLKVLLIESDMEPYIGKYSLLGDLVLPHEDLEEATLRVLKVRTGINDVYMEQVRSFGQVKRHPLGRVITVAFYSLVEINNVTVRDIDELNGLASKMPKVLPLITI
jgi:8-oxo-dGTP diphosphatase